MSVPALGGCAQYVESPHYDDCAPLHCLPEFAADDGVYFFVGVGVDIGIADVTPQNFQVGLVLYHVEEIHADGFDGGGVDVMIKVVDEMPSCHESEFVSQILFYIHDHHERGILVFFGG